MFLFCEASKAHFLFFKSAGLGLQLVPLLHEPLGIEHCCVPGQSALLQQHPAGSLAASLQPATGVNTAVGGLAGVVVAVTPSQ